MAAYPDGNVSGKPESWNRRWADLRAYAGRIADGEIADPCGGRAMHWGGLTIDADAERAERAVREGRWRRLDCGDTRNAFYAEVAARVLSAQEAGAR